LYKVANETAENRSALFRNTAAKMGVSEAIIEKDFWVCIVLDVLFHKSRFGPKLCFKGGTSLSKGYGLIQRFSEDIDLILDWTVLGYPKDEPLKTRSNSSQDKFNKKINEDTEAYLKNVFAPEICHLINDSVKDSFVFYIEEQSPQTVHLVYPHLFNDMYVAQEICLEIGTLGAWLPSCEKRVHPYVFDFYPHIFENGKTEIRMVEAKRTFWEKATILHREAQRIDEKTGEMHGKVPPRYSRHYYDLYMMTMSSVKAAAFADLNLLKSVADFKSKFYHSPWARYEDAIPGKIKLIPPQRIIETMSNDYDMMQAMIFGDKVAFKEIIAVLAELEEELRHL